MTKISKTNKYQVPARTLSNYNSYKLPVGMQNDRTIWENRLEVSHKIKHTLTTGPSNSIHKNRTYVYTKIYM